jgi:hypothetical protein
MVRTYQEVFAELYVFDVAGAGNKILIASPRRWRVEASQLARRARTVSEQRQFGFDLGELVRYGFQPMHELNLRGRVLTDKAKAKKAG